MTDTAQPHNPNERSASDHNAGERTLEERRAALKALMAAESTDVQEYHAVITGATEEERASLARTLTPKSVIGSDYINRTPLAAYVAGALVRTPDGDPWEYHRSAGRAMRTLLWEGKPDQQLIDAFLLGATERPEEWILRFIEGLPNSWAHSKETWEVCYRLLRARNLSCDAPEYLYLFFHGLPRVKKGSASNHAQLKTFFTRDMTLLDQEFWAVFRTEGVLFKGYGYYKFNGESAELCRLMGEYFDIRDEILDALLRGLTSDFSAFNVAMFHSVYTDLQPTDAENRARFGQLISALSANPSASVGFVQTMLRNVLKACAPSALQKNENAELAPLEQVELEQLIDALGANLYRTEKKIQRGALRLLKLIATQYAGVSKAKRKKAQTAEQAALANYVADRVLEAYEVLPLELRGAAEACLPEDRLPQVEEAEAAGASVEVPPVLLPGVEHREPVASIANLEEFCTLITEESNTTSGRITGDESPSTRGENLARLYHFAATDKLAPAEQQQLRTLRKIADHYSYNNVAYMPALCAVLEANAEAAGYKSEEISEMASIMQRFERSQLIWRRSSDHSKLISTEEMVRLVVQNKHHLWDPGYTSLEGYRDLYKIFREQMRAVAAGGEYHTEGRTVRLLSAPLPARQLTYSDWTYRTVSALDIPWSLYYSGLNDSKVEEYRKASQAGEPTGEFVAADFVRHEPMWQVESDITDTVDEAREALSHATASMSPEETIAYEVLNTAFIPFTFLPNASESYGWQGDFMTALTEWASWLLQNNPDLLSAYFLFAASECVEEKTVTPVPVLMRALRESTVQVGAPTCTLLGYVASAKNPEYRLAAAEAIAALFESGLLDTGTFAETLKWALEDGMVLPNRLVATLREVSAISPLAGWRVLQVLRLLLPMVGGLTKGGDYVRLAVELAELYGTPVEIPAVLEPKMKGSTVLAKSLRALAAVPARETEEALAAREAALALLGESGA